VALYFFVTHPSGTESSEAMFFKVFKKELKYSEFAHIGNLNAYTLDSLKSQIERMEIQEEQIGSLIHVMFTEPQTTIVLSFHLNGEFNKIESQKYYS
jgi:hypothetical protein